jgi:BASS family bile acid:Na+ symporter
MAETITVIAQLSAITFFFTSMLAMGLSLTVKQIMDPLRNMQVIQ